MSFFTSCKRDQHADALLVAPVMVTEQRHQVLFLKPGPMTMYSVQVTAKTNRPALMCGVAQKASSNPKYIGCRTRLQSSDVLKDTSDGGDFLMLSSACLIPNNSK